MVLRGKAQAMTCPSPRDRLRVHGVYFQPALSFWSLFEIKASPGVGGCAVTRRVRCRTHPRRTEGQ